MPGSPSNTLSPFPSFSDAFTQFSRGSLLATTPVFHYDLVAPLPSDPSATIKSSTDLLAHGLRRSKKPPLKRQRVAVRPEHFVPKTAREKDKNDKDEEASNETRGRVRREGPARSEAIVTRARSRGTRKRYREESSEEEAADRAGSAPSSDDDFM